MACLLVLQAALAPLLTFAVDGRPVRFGVPVSAEALAEGLSLRGRGVLQWRRLPVPESSNEVWIELAVVAPAGTVRVVRGGRGPSPDGRGPAFVCEQEERRLAYGVEHRRRWRWSDDTVDEQVRTVLTAAVSLEGEDYLGGEACTVVGEGLAARASPWLGQRSWGARVGLLPPRGGGGQATRAARRHLATVVDRLVELPGRRGAGDFARSGGVVTNLEFDTCFALLRCAVALGSERALELALRAARHLRDRDLDARSGLPFVHGPDHRSNLPEPGHVWLRGLLSTGLVTADDDAVLAARGIGRALATTLPMGSGRNERMRDYAWPLFELEALLALAPDRMVARAADRLAASIARRFDATARTFRFGEGELGQGLYLERAWLTGGLLLPALRLHLRRRPDAELERRVKIVETALLDLVGARADGLPTHWRIAAGRDAAAHRERGTVHRERSSVRACFLLDGFTQRDLSRLLRRSTVRRAIAGTPALDDPDLPTAFTLLARCDWVWR